MYRQDWKNSKGLFLQGSDTIKTKQIIHGSPNKLDKTSSQGPLYQYQLLYWNFPGRYGTVCMLPT